MHWIKLRNANCFRFCVGSLAAEWIITKARAITSAFMGTYIRGFLCRGFQTPSRSDWTGPADCSSETEAAWSPGEGGKKESIKKRGNMRDYPKKLIWSLGHLTDVPLPTYFEGLTKLYLT